MTAIVLAAGTSSRMGEANKLLLPVGGLPMVARVVEAVQAAVRGIVVVTGYERSAIEVALAAYPVRVAYNADYASGMASSIQRGVEAASEDANGFMLCLGDLPLLRPATVRLLYQQFVKAPSPAIVAPTCNGRRGHPVLFDAAFRDRLLQLDGDVGARSIVRAHDEAVVEVEVDDSGIFRDVDTRVAYDALAHDGHDTRNH